MAEGPADPPGVPPEPGHPSTSPPPNAAQAGYPQPVDGPPAAGYPVQPGVPVPPPTTPLPPGRYPYPTAAYPAAQSGYPVHPGYPAPGYPPAGYGVLPAKPHPPGVVKAAAVLAYIQGGILVVAGIGLLSSSTTFSDFGVKNRYTITVMIMSIVALLAGGLLLAGGVQAYNRKRALMIAGSAISLGLSIWWIIRFEFFGPVLVWSLLLAVLPVLCIALMTGAAGRAWTAKTRLSQEAGPS